MRGRGKEGEGRGGEEWEGRGGKEKEGRGGNGRSEKERAGGVRRKGLEE